MHSPRKAIVIGRGIAGSALSLCLERAGIVPRIFEAYPESKVNPAEPLAGFAGATDPFEEPPTHTERNEPWFATTRASPGVGGGFQIAPNGMAVMRSLGLAESVEATGAISRDFAFKNHHGRTIGRMDLGHVGKAVTTTRAAFSRVLMDAVNRRGIAVEYGKRLADVTSDDEGVVAHFHDGTFERGDVLFGADGVHSAVRQWMLPEYAKPRYAGVLSIGGFLAPDAKPPSDPADARRLNFVLGPRLQFGYANLRDSAPLWGWWCHLPEASELSRQEIQSIGNEELRRRALDVFAGWHAPVLDFIRATRSFIKTSIYDVPSLPAWHRGRVLLVGDAAHAMCPAGGQGASLALEDAFLVAKLFEEPGVSIEDVFARFERERRPRAEHMVEIARKNDERQLRQMSAFGCWLRDRTFPVLAPLFARALERQYRDGPVPVA